MISLETFTSYRTETNVQRRFRECVCVLSFFCFFFEATFFKICFKCRNWILILLSIQFPSLYIILMMMHASQFRLHYQHVAFPFGGTVFNFHYCMVESNIATSRKKLRFDEYKFDWIHHSIRFRCCIALLYFMNRYVHTSLYSIYFQLQ